MTEIGVSSVSLMTFIEIHLELDIHAEGLFEGRVRLHQKMSGVEPNKGNFDWLRVTHPQLKKL